MASTAGELVTERFDYDGGRLVSVYVPADPPETVVFAGDGQLLSVWGADLEALDLPPTLIVGAHRLGYWVDPRARKRGVATTAVRDERASPQSGGGQWGGPGR